MTPLRGQFIRELVIRGMAPKTQEAYVRVVRDLAGHYHKEPDLVSDDELKDYLLYLAEGKQLSRSSVNVAVNGMRCFFDLVLKRDCEHLKRMVPHCKKAIRRPRVYSIEELERLFTFGCVHQASRLPDDSLRGRLAPGGCTPRAPRGQLNRPCRRAQV